MVKDQNIRVGGLGSGDHPRQAWLESIAPELRADHHVHLCGHVVAKHQDIRAGLSVAGGHADPDLGKLVEQGLRHFLAADEFLHEPVHPAKIPCDLEEGHLHECGANQIAFLDRLDPAGHMLPPVVGEKIRPWILRDLPDGFEFLHGMHHFLEMCGRTRRSHDSPFGIPVERARSRRQGIEENRVVGGQPGGIELDGADRKAIKFRIIRAPGPAFEFLQECWRKDEVEADLFRLLAAQCTKDVISVGHGFGWFGGNHMMPNLSQASWAFIPPLIASKTRFSP